MRRRDFLQAAGTAAAGGALWLGSGCGDNAAPIFSAAVLEVDDGSALVWAEGYPQAVVTIEITTEAGGRIDEQTIRLGANGVGWIEVRGLRPATRYVAVLDGAEVRFVTAPAADDLRSVRLAWSGDCDIDPQFDSPLFSTLARLQPDVFVSLGDFPYADNGNAQLEAEYRAAHRAFRRDPRVQSIFSACSVRAIYDDHEVRNDWDAGTWAREPARHHAALGVWDEFFPLRMADQTAPDVRYRSWRWGGHVEAFVLDTRRFRSDRTSADTGEKTMLGARQRQWLIDGVRGSTARFKLIFTTVPLDFGFTDDHWPAFARERGELFSALRGTTGVLFLSADQHWFAAHRHPGGVREFQAGPISRGVPEPPPPAQGVLTRIFEYNVGLLTIGETGTLTVECIGARGDSLYREMLTADELVVV